MKATHAPPRAESPPRKRTQPAAGRDEAAAAVRVLRQFRLVFNTVKTHFQQMEKRAGLGGAQVWALSVVRDQPGIGVNELARAMDVRQPTASNLVKSLAEQDCIEVRRDDRDGRAVRLHIRPGGARVLRKAKGPFTGVLPEALASLEPSTLERLEQDLEALIEVLGADERGANILLSQMLARSGAPSALPTSPAGASLPAHREHRVQRRGHVERAVQKVHRARS